MYWHLWLSEMARTPGLGKTFAENAEGQVSDEHEEPGRKLVREVPNEAHRFVAELLEAIIKGAAHECRQPV